MQPLVYGLHTDSEVQVCTRFIPLRAAGAMWYTIVSQASTHSRVSKRPCTTFQEINVHVAASIQVHGSYIAHAGQNHKLCLSAHGDTMVISVRM